MEYKDLYGVIPSDVWSKFCFDEYYSHEKTILQPYLESVGYTNVVFHMGERDSFGPLSRICCATKGGNRERFVYG